jgi:hypothetical protein
VSSASNIDPDIAAAFSGTPPSASSHANIDPDISAAFADTGQQSSKNDDIYDPEGDAARAEVGGSQLVTSALANIPHATAHAISDFVTGGKPDSAAVEALRVPLGEEGKKVASGLATAAAPVTTPIKKGIDTADTALGNFSPTLQDIVHNTVRVGGDVANILPLTGIVKGLGFPGEVAEEIPATAQDVAGQVAAKQSGGAAGSPMNVAEVSPPLRSVIANANPDRIDPVAMNNHIEADSHGVELTKGQATRDPIQFSQEQNSTHPDIVARLNAQNGQMTDALDTIRREASPTTVGNDAIENGQTVVDALKAYDEPVKADISAKYKALADAGGGKIPMNGRLFADQADAALTENNSDVFLPKEIRTIVDRARAQGESGMTYNNFENMRTQLATAARSATDGNVRNAINTVRSTLESVPMDEATGPIRQLADTARAAAKSRFDALNADPAYQAAVDDVGNGVKKGEPSPLADRFLDKYVLGTAPKANVDLLTSKLDADAQGAVTSHALNAIRKAAVSPNGNVLPNGYNGAMAKYGPKLDSLVSPDVQDKLESLGRTITNAKVAPAGSFVNYSKSGVVANAAQGLGEAAINAKTMGMGVPILKGMIKSRFAKDALAPGAGIER